MEENIVLAEKVGELLRQRHLTMGTAESCTGGTIASMITSVAGSSDYFVGRVLGVSEESLRLHGAVSREVVEQMATGAARVLGCDCAVATSGVAGPGGGTKEKPVGTVWIAAVCKGALVSHCFRFGSLRSENIRSASAAALRMLIELMKTPR